MSAPLAVDQQAAQSGLAIVTGQALAAAWPNLDVTNLKATTPRFADVTHAIIDRHAKAAATLAARYYVQTRHAHGLGRFTALPAKPPGADQVRSTVDWAVSGLYGPQPDVAAFQDRMTAAAQKLVQDTGRQTVIENVARDRQAKGWTRVTEPSPCFFCAMLATRGAVYKRETSADFQTHDACRCHAEPVFTAYEPSAQVREWQALYEEHAPGPGGSKAAQLRFRRAFEGRAEPTPHAFT